MSTGTRRDPPRKQTRERLRAVGRFHLTSLSRRRRHDAFADFASLSVAIRGGKSELYRLNF
jgi:hypothetical protein